MNVDVVKENENISSLLRSPKAKKGDLTPVLADKLRRMITPLYSGGLEFSEISELNYMIEKELALLSKGFLRNEFSLELRVHKPISLTINKPKDQSKEELL